MPEQRKHRQQGSSAELFLNACAERKKIRRSLEEKVRHLRAELGTAKEDFENVEHTMERQTEIYEVCEGYKVF